MPKFFTYQRPAPVSKQSWGGKPGHPYGPNRKPVKVSKSEQQAAPKLPPLPTKH